MPIYDELFHDPGAAKHSAQVEGNQVRSGVLFLLQQRLSAAISEHTVHGPSLLPAREQSCCSSNTAMAASVIHYRDELWHSICIRLCQIKCLHSLHNMLENWLDT